MNLPDPPPGFHPPRQPPAYPGPFRSGIAVEPPPVQRFEHRLSFDNPFETAFKVAMGVMIATAVASIFGVLLWTVLIAALLAQG